MKKVVCLLVVIAMTTPLIGQTVKVNVTDIGDGKVQIGYVNDPCDLVPSADLPVGIALKVVVAKGQIAALDSYDNEEFSVYIDHVYDDPCGYTWDSGHPLAASESAPGALDLGDLPISEVVICMGRLDPCAAGPNPGPDTVANLVTLQLEQDPCDPCTYATVTVSEESNYRGGVVGGTMGTDLPKAANVLFAADCVNSAAPFYNGGGGWASWTGWGSPKCWCYEYNCRGDIDGQVLGPYRVATADLTIFKAAYFQLADVINADPARVCADNDRKMLGPYLVATADLTTFKANYFQLGVTACPLDFDGDSDDDYNFWETP